jgi:hypothetical protein
MLNQKEIEYLEIRTLKLHNVDNDNEIEIEKDGWSVWISIDETKQVIDFLNNQLNKIEFKNKLVN